MALPHCAAAPTSAIALDRGNDAPGSSCVSERNQHLIQHDLVQDRIAGLAQTFSEAAARRQVRSIRSANPLRPNDRNAAHTSTPRARVLRRPAQTGEASDPLRKGRDAAVGYTREIARRPRGGVG